MPRKSKARKRSKVGGNAGTVASQKVGPTGNSSNTFRVESHAAGSLIVNPSRSVGFFPDRARTTLRYVEKVTFTSTTGAAAQYDFAGNSAYDPNVTGTGGQPANYDDLMVHYNRYRVIASRCSASIASLSTTNGTMDVVLYPSNSSIAATVVDQIAQPYSVFSTVTPNSSILSGYATTEKITGRNPRTTDSLSALYNADPADLWVWHFVYRASDSATTTNVYAVVILDYDIEVFDRNDGGLDSIAERVRILQDIRKIGPKKARGLISPKELADSKESASSPEEDFVELQSLTAPKVLSGARIDLRHPGLTPNNTPVSNRSSAFVSRMESRLAK